MVLLSVFAFRDLPLATRSASGQFWMVPNGSEGTKQTEKPPPSRKSVNKVGKVGDCHPSKRD